MYIQTFECIYIMKRNVSKKLSVDDVCDSLKALAHPDRIDILLLLARRKDESWCVSDIHKRLGFSQPETSRHLSIMKDKDVVSNEKFGTNVYYSVNFNNPVIASLVDCLTKQIQGRKK